jgi:hypothetical protein
VLCSLQLCLDGGELFRQVGRLVPDFWRHGCGLERRWYYKKTTQQRSREDWSLRKVLKVSYNTGTYIY